MLVPKRHSVQESTWIRLGSGWALAVLWLLGSSQAPDRLWSKFRVVLRLIALLLINNVVDRALVGESAL